MSKKRPSPLQQPPEGEPGYSTGEMWAHVRKPEGVGDLEGLDHLFVVLRSYAYQASDYNWYLRPGVTLVTIETDAAAALAVLLA